MQLAQLCHSCGYGLRKAECLKCGGTIQRGIVAELCASCASKAQNHCIKCGKRIEGTGVAAVLCGHCSYDPAGKKCIRCQKYLDNSGDRLTNDAGACISGGASYQG